MYRSAISENCSYEVKNGNISEFFVLVIIILSYKLIEDSRCN
jgi:hypothetical protein